MAKFEQVLQGNFDKIVHYVEDGILKGSLSASLEEQSDFVAGDSRCAVRVFERYSYMGGNRLSLSVTFFQHAQDAVYMSAITAGGSQALVFKVNTLGEEAFLEKLKELVSRIPHVK